MRLSLNGDHALVKDADGSWSVTLGPLEPEIYEYNFLIDGAKVLDIQEQICEDWDLLPPAFSTCPRILRVSIRCKMYHTERFKSAPIRPRLSRSNEISTFISRRNMIREASA